MLRRSFLVPVKIPAKKPLTIVKRCCILTVPTVLIELIQIERNAGGETMALSMIVLIIIAFIAIILFAAMLLRR